MYMEKYVSYENIRQIADILNQQLSIKADKETTYTKNEVDDLIAASSGGVGDGSGNININTSGATNSNDKLFIVGAPTQDVAPITYTNNLVYIGTDGCLYSNNDKVITTNTETKNTAGSTDTSNKLFLIGATTQANSPQTYSHDTAYVDTDGCLYSGNKKTITADKDFGETEGLYNLSDGLQIRYGQYTGNISNNRFTITFDVPFPNGCLYAQCTSSVQDTNTIVGPRGIYAVLNKNATSVQFAIPNYAKQPFWVALGY